MPISRLLHHLYTDPAFVFTILMSGVNDTFLLPLEVGGTYDFSVDWGDGTNDNITAWDAAETTHTYAAAGTYVIRITRTIHAFAFDWAAADRFDIREIREWGPVRLGNSAEYFYGCTNLTVVATDALDLTGTTNFSLFFKVCDYITTIPGMGDWDVSAVTDMDGMFYGCHVFNQDLDSWDTSSCADMADMFTECYLFDNPLDSWDVSNVTTMSFMFLYASIFNQPLNSWTPTSAIYMHYLFSNADKFNQPLNSWDVSSVTRMEYMFQHAIAFNQDLNSWNTAAVTMMYGMFQDAIAFNGNISSWNTAAVTRTHYMFQDAVAFNQDISGWNMAAVTHMYYMFDGATAFNQNIGGWSTGASTSFKRMFRNATSFDQDLSGWDITSVTDMEEMFLGVTLSTANYDALLIGWEGQVEQPNVTFHGGGSKYSAGAAATARAALVANGWNITDGGQV